MKRTFSVIALMLAGLSFQAPAIAEDDELVRLPGQGEVRDETLRKRAKADRLKPASGLFISFDVDENGRISPDEIKVGIPAAFADADRNQDGYLTALEQQDWAAGLPTRDDSLANPFRFDPNLDRRVDPQEFAKVIGDLGREYADELSGEIIVSDLKAPKPIPTRRQLQIERELERRAETQRNGRLER